MGLVANAIRDALIAHSRRVDRRERNQRYPQTRQMVRGRKGARAVFQGLCMYALGHELSSDYLESRKAKVAYRCRWCDATLDRERHFGRWLRVQAVERI
ncbi:MAG: hypothetical protein FJZ01_21510 [Candidatus Sericytochromatia bacterium]|nr:hypothetical protein [Candidatus Tanganyikabacteria bacterium]